MTDATMREEGRRKLNNVQKQNEGNYKAEKDTRGMAKTVKQERQ